MSVQCYTASVYRREEECNRMVPSTVLVHWEIAVLDKGSPSFAVAVGVGFTESFVRQLIPHPEVAVQGNGLPVPR